MKSSEKPIDRSPLRFKLGCAYYGARRRLKWLTMEHKFAKKRQAERLPVVYFTHRTPMRRKLKDLEMWMQENKVTNLKLAVARMDGLLLRPGEIFSYWRLIGKPTYRRGFLDGMILRNGKITPGVGGGLCQLANMIFWMTAHTPLTVIERHRHGYDVFPDANRTQPFASGATCFYPHVDLMIQNNTNDIFQLCLTVEKDDLVGEWRVYNEPNVKYEVVERNHEMRLEIWGGYTRHNELYKQKFTLDGQFIDEELLVQNSAIMMYSPYLNEPGEQKRYDGSQYNIWDDN